MNVCFFCSIFYNLYERLVYCCIYAMCSSITTYEMDCGINPTPLETILLQCYEIIFISPAPPQKFIFYFIFLLTFSLLSNSHEGKRGLPTIPTSWDRVCICLRTRLSTCCLNVVKKSQEKNIDF
uniref:Uncharacterized protein n=1 Tax=Cacopsylla melanoneura TaxID=428564 RepID=A0A8D8YHP6_9HEMI